MRTGFQDSICKKGPIGIINNINNVTNGFELKQNYPNPFNPETKIGFSIGKAGNVKIKIFDIIGREVATLVNQKLNQGTYVVSWQASNMPSGVYFYVIEAGDFKETKKMIILK